VEHSSFAPFSWERVIWTARPWPLDSAWGRPLDVARGRPRRRDIEYILTDVRLVVAGQEVEIEIPVTEIAALDLRAPTLFERIVGRRTVVITQQNGGTITLPGLRRRQILALAQLLVGRESVELTIDPTLVEDAVAAAAPVRSRVIGIAALAAIFAASIAIGLHGDEPPIAYPTDDAIHPGGAKRSTTEIIRFMERDVMPWARETLGPVVGGGDRVTCDTCHGVNGEARGWAMPGVAELPYPRVREGGLGSTERYAWSSSDPQLRNAVYADLAQDDRQATAAYMRQVVMPGMARLLRRPTYDFARSYGENRTRFAFGCYHCHRVR
jgi:hypothetical protein